MHPTCKHEVKCEFPNTYKKLSITIDEEARGLVLVQTPTLLKDFRKHDLIVDDREPNFVSVVTEDPVFLEDIGHWQVTTKAHESKD